MSDDPRQEGLTEKPRPEMALDVQYPNVDTFLEDYSVNISRGGALIQIGRDIVVGDSVDLHLSFPGLLVPLVVHGVVRWVQPEATCGYAAGIELHAGEPREAEALAETVRRIKAGDRQVVAPVVRVMVVDDNSHVAKLIADGLHSYPKRCPEPLSFSVRIASNGKDALALLEEQGCDVLFVDMYLPIMDGEQLIRATREDPNRRKMPIVALSAGGEEAKERAVNAGADYFLQKPVRLADLTAVIRKMVSAGHLSLS